MDEYLHHTQVFNQRIKILYFKFRIGYGQILYQLCFLVVDAFPQENVKDKYP